MDTRTDYLAQLGEQVFSALSQDRVPSVPAAAMYRSFPPTPRSWFIAKRSAYRVELLVKWFDTLNVPLKPLYDSWADCFMDQVRPTLVELGKFSMQCSQCMVIESALSGWAHLVIAAWVATVRCHRRLHAQMDDVPAYIRNTLFRRSFMVLGETGEDRQYILCPTEPSSTMDMILIYRSFAARSWLPYQTWFHRILCADANRPFHPMERKPKKDADESIGLGQPVALQGQRGELPQQPVAIPRAARAARAASGAPSAASGAPRAAIYRTTFQGQYISFVIA